MEEAILLRLKRVFKTPQITINVDKLPAGKPMNLVVVWEIFLSLPLSNETKVKTNDAVTIKLVVSGTGKLKVN